MDAHDYTFPSIIREANDEGKLFFKDVHPGDEWSPLAWERIISKVKLQANIARFGNEEALYRFSVYFRYAMHHLTEHDDRPRAWKLLAIAHSITHQFIANRNWAMRKKPPQDKELFAEEEFVSRVALAEPTYYVMRLAAKYRIRLTMDKVLVRVFWEPTPAIVRLPNTEETRHA